jgi:hypothetical protein
VQQRVQNEFLINVGTAAQRRQPVPFATVAGSSLTITINGQARYP